MNHRREERIWELEQELARLPRDQWAPFLELMCPEDESLRAEVLARQAQLKGTQLSTVAAIAFAAPLPSVELPQGVVLNSRYRIIGRVGSGGMGTVYQALDLRLRNIVAIKRLTAEGPDADGAFQREANLLAALRHPALPVVIDSFVTHAGRFLVMQYIDGEDLETVRLQYGRACPSHEVAAWALAVVAALTYLHSHQPPILHRDIKPSNLKRTPRGEIVLLDFGLAKGRADSHTTAASGTHSVVGFTPDYAPLEQLERRGTDPRSDLYALGATLYHLATGFTPSSATDRAKALAMGRPDPLVEASRLNPDVSKALAAVISRAMELEPAGRFANAEEMRRAILQHEPITARPTHDAVAMRRVDAAMPSQAEVDRQVDLIVQVRFADSPPLGLEDWPTRRRPAAIEQGSEAVRVVYPVDSKTRAPLPARLLLKIVAPDFTIEGHEAQVIEIPPDDYSKRVVFLLTARRAGYCRVNVEVYDGDAVYLGAIPVEAEAVATVAAPGMTRVANLMLTMCSEDASKAAVDAAAAGPIRAESATPPGRRWPMPGRRKAAGWLRTAGPVFALLFVTGAVLWRQAAAPKSVAPSAPSVTDPASPIPTGTPIVTSLDYPMVSLTVVEVTRSGPDRARVSFEFANNGTEPVTIAIAYAQTFARDGAGANYRVMADGRGTPPRGAFSAVIPPRDRLRHWIEFRVSESAVGPLEISLAAPSPRPTASATFPPFTVPQPR